MKKTYFLSLLLTFCLASASATALTINPQNDVKCFFDDCSLTVNLSKYLSATTINTIKSLNLNTYLVKNGLDLKYNWSNTSITFYAKIAPNSNNYWYFAHPAITVDPWFNYTRWLWVNNTWTNPKNLDSPAAGGGYWRGVQIKTHAYSPNVSVRITGIEKDSDTTLANTTCLLIKYVDKSVIATGTFSGNTCMYSTAPVLLNNTDYWVGMLSALRTKADSPAYPYASTDFDVIHTSYASVPPELTNASWTTYDGEIWDVAKIYSSTNSTSDTTIWWETHLFINNAEANITTACSGTTSNYTGTQNLSTNWPISLMYNNTLVNTSNGTVMWYGSLIAGVWNFTANASNASTGGSAWLIHTITKGTPWDVNLTFNTTPATNNTTCINLPLLINCSSDQLESGQKLYNSTHEVGFDYVFTPTGAGSETFVCNWTAGDCYDAGSMNRTLTISTCIPEPPVSNATCTYLPDSSIYTISCWNATHKLQSWLYANSTCYAWESCAYGCDNITNICNPPTYQTNLLMLGLLVFAMIGGIAFLRWVL